MVDLILLYDASYPRNQSLIEWRTVRAVLGTGLRLDAAWLDKKYVGTCPRCSSCLGFKTQNLLLPIALREDYCMCRTILTLT